MLSLGGGAYAAITLSKNSVGSRELKPNAVRSGDIRNGGVKARDLAKGLRVGVPGPAGPQGPAGAAGPQGPVGASAAALVTRAELGPYTANDNDPHLVGSFSWTQPAGTLDDVRGYMGGLPNGADCISGDTVEYWVLVDGKEISADGDNGAFDGTGVSMVLAGTASVFRDDPMAIDGALEPAAQAAEHTLQLFVEATCATNNPSADVVFPTMRFYVTRFG